MDCRLNAKMLEVCVAREKDLVEALRVAKVEEERIQRDLCEEKELSKKELDEEKERFKKDANQSAKALREALEATKKLQDKLVEERGRAIKEFRESPEFGVVATEYTIPLFGDMVGKMAKELQGRDPPVDAYFTPSLCELLPPPPVPEAEASIPQA